MAIKVMVVDDSAFMRKIISDLLKDNKDIDVPWTAKNGQDALNQLKHVIPDVITLDIEMPIMDGISTLHEIVRLYNIPVIMLSSLTVSGAELTIKALEIGAFDFITKPTNIFKLINEEEKHNLIEKVKAAAQVKGSSKPRIAVTETKNTKKIYF